MTRFRILESATAQHHEAEEKFVGVALVRAKQPAVRSFRQNNGCKRYLQLAPRIAQPLTVPTRHVKTFSIDV